MKILKFNQGFISNHSCTVHISYFLLIKEPVKGKDEHLVLSYRDIGKYGVKDPLTSLYRKDLKDQIVIHQKLKEEIYKILVISSGANNWDYPVDENELDDITRKEIKEILKRYKNRYPSLELLAEYTDGSCY